MKNILNKWRYYTLGKEQYYQCMRKVFLNNLYSLRQSNIVITVFAFCFMLFPIVIEKNLHKAGIYFITVIVALLLAVFANHRYKQFTREKQVKHFHVYMLTTVYYVNIILFGIYLGIWANPDKLAVSFMTFLICAFFLFITSPLYNLLLTLGAMTVFIVSAIIVKDPQNWVFDIANVLVAGSVSLIFGWQVTMLRMVSALSVSRLKEDSTVDELTRLKNRRDFMQTFQRRLSNYRSSDDWLCIAIMDIDFFKDYNDHYGHTQGDECLRSIGKALNILGNTGIYAARVGGEEFALLWPEKEAKHIQNTISRIQLAINELKIPHAKSKVADHVTVSIGIHTVRSGSSDDINTLYDIADKALYAAKRSGRNRAVIHGTEP